MAGCLHPRGLSPREPVGRKAAPASVSLAPSSLPHPSGLDKGHFCSRLGLCGPQESLGTLLLCHLPKTAQGPQIPQAMPFDIPVGKKASGPRPRTPPQPRLWGTHSRHIPSQPSVWATERRGEGRPMESKSPIPLGRGAWWKGPVEVNEPRAV